MDQRRNETTTKKHRSFTSEPINDKGVKSVPGIGKVYGERLKYAGFETAQSILDKFLELHKDGSSFKNWLYDICKANTRSQDDCCSALNEWCNRYQHYVTGPYYI